MRKLQGDRARPGIPGGMTERMGGVETEAFVSFRNFVRGMLTEKQQGAASCSIADLYALGWRSFCQIHNVPLRIIFLTPVSEKMLSCSSRRVNISSPQVRQLPGLEFAGELSVTSSKATVRDLIRQHYASLTQSERKFASALLKNYPASGLVSITAAAENAGVSAPTVARMVQKLGFKGYPQFHKTLLDELEAKGSGPTRRRNNWASEAPETHLLNRFTQAVTSNLSQTFANIDTESFDAAVSKLATVSQPLYIVGGRITHALADYAFTHLQPVRPGVTHMTSSSGTWPHYVLDMEAGETLLMFDIRRYENNLLRLAELAIERGVCLILVTDQWGSPVSVLADHTFNCWVEIPSAWDSNVSTMMLLEAMIAAVQEKRWPQTRERYERLDELFDLTRFFRKFI